MNWADAVAAMRGGAIVRRVSQSVSEPVGRVEGALIMGEGFEPYALMTARTEGGDAVRVFMGAWSGVLLDPDVDDELADDWIVVPDSEGRLKP
ncbi:hypothetical protein [Piscinibacter gummiphilus]|uniref:DUF2829 domain-containing protein n=1 Tax=Piscinibacter gummiphilus TaxID=946333 RepID=A0ABZ0CND2_9BURK|nr:hypothetical protein [Piscinibacter gummiphilus]WOB06482.1 hypothetical protein RXV79_16290 [Piscinibacter gummiphilus]